MSKEALKFFHNWIKEMIDIGGPNLPKAVSTRLGTNLGILYKKRGISDIQTGLRTSYEVLKGTPSIEIIDDTTIEVKIEYSKEFCPIGGGFNKNKAEIIQESLCYPYTIAFLNAIDPRFNYKGIVHECILSSNKRFCKFTLKLEKKNTQKKSKNEK